MIAAYRDPDRTAAKAALAKIIDRISTGVPAELSELITLGRTLKRRADRRPGLLRPARHQQRTH